MFKKQKILTEERLRAIQKCSEFGIYYEAEEKLDLLNQIIKDSYIHMITRLIRENYKADLAALITNSINKTIQKSKETNRLLDSEVSNLKTRAILGINEINQKILLDRFVPIYSRIPVNIKVSKTLINLEIAATYRKTKNIIHYVDFLPSPRLHSLEWDSPTFCKLYYLHRLQKQEAYNHYARAHLFHFSETNAKSTYYVIDSPSVAKKQKIRLNNLVKLFEANLHYPVIPCNFACAFKARCQPGVIDDESTRS